MTPKAIRPTVRHLVLPGQRRIHMKHEQDRRRRTIVVAVTALPIRLTIYDAARRYRTNMRPGARASRRWSTTWPVLTPGC
jgi:hypothetical protein